MKIIKLGGSLMSDMDSLIHCLNTVEKKCNKAVLVPGGGVFANQVRTVQQQWGFNDLIAHQMALLAMKQMALLFKSIKPCFELAESLSTIKANMANNAIVIWSPCMQEFELSEIEASWNVTSDSLAAWLAGQLTAEELILVKSADISTITTIKKMQQQGVVDKAFIRFIENATYKITLINKQQFNENTLI